MLEGTSHQCLAVSGVFVGQILSVARADDLLRWIVPKHPGRKCNVRGVRFQGLRKQVENQTLRLRDAAFLQRFSHELDVSVVPTWVWPIGQNR